MNAATTFQTIRNWFTGQQSEAAQRPMAILRDESQAYKPANTTAATRPQLPATRPYSAAARLALRQASQQSQATLQLVPATAATRPPSRLYAAGRTPALQTGGHPRQLAAVTLEHLYLSGKLSEVCQQLEQLVAQEEQFLRLG